MQKLQVTNGVTKKYYIVGVKRIIYLFFWISFVCNIIPIYVKILREYNFNEPLHFLLLLSLPIMIVLSLLMYIWWHVQQPKYNSNCRTDHKAW